MIEETSTSRTKDFFRERARRADVSEALRILDHAGSVPAQSGDELRSQAEVHMDADRVLREAIRLKRLVRFQYKGRERIVEPHDYGLQKGVARLLSWQVGGQSSGRIPGWRWFDVDDMQGVEMLGRSFPGNREVPGKHHQWNEVFARVAPPTTTKR